MKIELDDNTKTVAGWSVLSYLVIAVILLMMFLVNGYRAERLAAIEHGLIPQHTVVQPQRVLVNDYVKTTNETLFPNNDWLTK